MTWQAHIRTLALAGAALLLLTSCAHKDAARAALLDADRAMGGASLKTLRYAGKGTGAVFGQAYQAGMAWPRVNLPAFARLLDYENGAMREEAVRNRAEPTGGGSDQRSTGLLRGSHAWNQVGPAAVPAPAAGPARTHDLWTTPHGVIKAGLRSTPTLRIEGSKRVVSFSDSGRFRAAVWINLDGLVERVDSVLPDAVLGDTPVVTLYSAYQDFGGIKFPTRIRQSRGGFAVLDLEVLEVTANIAAGIEVPGVVASFSERVVVERVAEGIWFLSGGSHNSVLIEMADHLILVESPLYSGRALAVLAEVQKLSPSKPLRYVINSHLHFDHSGGLRTAVAAGATLVASEHARLWFERVLANPNSISPDALARSGQKAVVSGVNGQRTFTDAGRTVEVFMIEDSVHVQGFMMVWLPRERLLVQADAYTPGPPGAPAPALPNASHVNLVNNLERLKLDPERILPLHGRIVPASELYNAVARRP